MSITSIVVMVSQVYAYVQTHKTVYTEYVRFLYTSYTSIQNYTSLISDGYIINYLKSLSKN